MKHYLIMLPNYPASVDMARRAYISAQQQGWDMDLWPGVDGATITVEDLEKTHGLKICDTSSKCRAMMQTRAGVRGCFLSHWYLWSRCVELDEPIGIFEHDVIFEKPPVFSQPFTDILKLEGFDLKPPRPAGPWYEGARAYIITPQGAEKLITWAKTHGCLPADVAIGTDVVDIAVQDTGLVSLQIDHANKHRKHIDSFTWNLSGMERQ